MELLQHEPLILFDINLFSGLLSSVQASNFFYCFGLALLVLVFVRFVFISIFTCNLSDVKHFSYHRIDAASRVQFRHAKELNYTKVAETKKGTGLIIGREVTGSDTG